jgi:heavy metal translocating P-type ATPase
MNAAVLDKILLGILAVLLLLNYGHFAPPSFISNALAAASFLGLLPVAWSALKSIRMRKVSVDLLASIALVVSLLTGEWASAAFINLMLTFARLFGAYTESKARRAIESLLKMRPEKVRVQRGDKVELVPVEEVVVNDLVVIETGDRIPVDGIVMEGQASIDQSSLTGESVPVNKAVNDKVFSSTLAEAGSLLVRAEKVGKDTTLEKIIALVESSQAEKPGIHTTADKFAARYIGIILIGSIVVYFVFHDLSLLLSLLLVVCADDLAVAVPMAFLAAIGYAAHRGVIVKGGAYLEGLTKVTTVITDKTGTITRGRLKLELVHPTVGVSPEELLKCALAVESYSHHPMARAIIEYCGERNIPETHADDFKEYPGKGIGAQISGGEVLCGTLQFLGDHGIVVPGAELSRIVQQEESGFSVILVSFAGKYAGALSVADEIRPESVAAIARLKVLGIKNVVMLTGDNEKVAARVAREVGITEFHAGLLPEQKLAYVKAYIQKGERVAMLGDGVNDAAALALADVGVAMGAIGSDTAIEAADIALMHDDLNEIAETIELGRYTKKIAHQDFGIWAVSNAVGIALVSFGYIGPQGAAMYNFLTDFFPLFNSLRLFNLHLKLPHVAKRRKN